MSILAHLETLEEKHARYESLVTEEMARPLPDFRLITELKKQKLRVKEEMERIDRIRAGSVAAHAVAT